MAVLREDGGLMQCDWCKTIANYDHSETCQSIMRPYDRSAECDCGSVKLWRDNYEYQQSVWPLFFRLPNSERNRGVFLPDGFPDHLCRKCATEL